MDWLWFIWYIYTHTYSMYIYICGLWIHLVSRLAAGPQNLLKNSVLSNGFPGCCSLQPRRGPLCWFEKKQAETVAGNGSRLRILPFHLCAETQLPWIPSSPITQVAKSQHLVCSFSLACPRTPALGSAQRGSPALLLGRLFASLLMPWLPWSASSCSW
jgi:hypothetical protein